MFYRFLVVYYRVVIHLIQAVAKEVCVLVGEMNQLQSTLNVVIKLCATWIYLIRSMDMSVNELANKLNLLVAAESTQLRTFC